MQLLRITFLSAGGRALLFYQGKGGEREDSEEGGKAKAWKRKSRHLARERLFKKIMLKVMRVEGSLL